ncbi:hypothetical protein GGQ73_000596 [Rhizobium skierniewicense]|uniref:Uncharacterized protein n=1 Tax=Rhizobium skierniewicense TaxID=984260 RepID=A0A7W6CCE2_9HYPH|nr:hypothetical protein [Rhizobium skierniewicense]MBB3944671.1 hypothetical protein [Rhizobium skierniewicense]
MTNTYHHDPAFLKAVETLIQTIQFDVNGTAGKGGNGGLTSDKAIRQSGELNIMMDRIKKLEAATPPVDSLQDRVQPWMMACFGPEISADKLERADRLLEEVFELLQSGEYPRERIRALEEYTFSRERGEPAQEVGGVMITLAAYCLAHELDMHHAGEVELSRIWTKVEKIRAKQAAKPTGSALPVAMTAHSARVQEVPVFGPFAHLNGVHGLSEEYWTVDNDPGTDDDELFSIPLYSLVDPFTAAPTAIPEIEVGEEPECCVACDVPLEVGDLVYWCSSDDSGHLHADCCGPDRESYVHPDGSPLKDDEPIPAPFAWKPDNVAPSDAHEDGRFEEVK